MLRDPVGVSTVCDDAVGIGRILMDHCQGAVRIGGEDIGRGGLIAGTIHAHADGKRGDDLPVLIVGDGEDSAAASAEEAMMRGINRHGDRLAAGSGGPAAGDFESLAVDLDDFAGVGEIGVDFAVARRGAVFGFAAEVEIRDACAARRDR